MERKGFTLVELLVVIAIIALLMGILMPALSRVRQIAFRMVCGTNLSGIGKAMLIYANDYDDELPRAGGRGTEWGGTVTWDAADRFDAYSLSTPDGTGGQATVSSNFYLLVKYAEVTPKSFVCKGDAGTTEFKLVDYQNRNDDCKELIDAWDFGGSGRSGDPATTHCSYAYHHPYSKYSLTTASEPGMAVAADRNPWIESPAADARPFRGTEADGGPFTPDMPPYNGTQEQARYGNANAHQQDGQNVLFLDSHVNFEKRSYCGVEDDNIYTYVISGSPVGNPIGEGPVVYNSEPGCRKDSFLIHDIEGSGPVIRPH
jgi:prepilin-type N-terminal cleavage/methylation domain-containing protein